MKTILFTSLFVGAICFLVHAGLRHQTSQLRSQIRKSTWQKHEEDIKNQQEAMRESQRRRSEILPTGEDFTSPFLEKINRELENENGPHGKTPTAYLQKLRDLRFDEIKLLTSYLETRLGDTHAKHYSLYQACQLILLEADPRYLLHEESLRDISYGAWAIRTRAAFQALLRRDSTAAEVYYKSIPDSDLKSAKYPFKYIQREMMGYFLRNNPEEMIRSFLFQAPEKRYLPSEGSLIRFTSLEQAMPYAKLLRTLPDDHYTSASLRRRIAREAYRIGGLGGIEQFSRAHAGPDKSEEEQLKLLLQTSIPIYSRNQADEYFAFLSSLEDQWGLSSNYRDLV